MNFIAKKMKEQDSFRLVKENSDGTGVFIYKGESVILKRCKNGYWKDPKTGECVPSSQLQGTSQPKDVKPKDEVQNKPDTSSTEQSSEEKWKTGHELWDKESKKRKKIIEELSSWVKPYKSATLDKYYESVLEAQSLSVFEYNRKDMLSYMKRKGASNSEIESFKRGLKALWDSKERLREIKEKYGKDVNNYSRK